MKKNSVLIVSAGVSEHSSTNMLAERIGREVLGAFENHGAEANIQMISLRDLAGDLGASMATGMIGETLQEAMDKVSSADGLIAATPVYKASYSGLFKAFFDLLDDDALLSTPTVLAATAGTPRHALVPDEQMRPLFAFLRALVVPTSVFAATEDWSTSALTVRAKRAAEELVPLVLAGTKNMTLQSSDAYDRSYAIGTNAPRDASEGVNFDSDLMRLAAGGR